VTKIRALEIQNFRGIRALTWYPSPGVNCLVGPGDSGKSTILDAIDLCLAPRRTVQFNDGDFYLADSSRDISIAVTLGDLSESMLTLEAYGHHFRGMDLKSQKLEDEPDAGLETVLTVELTVSADLEPTWLLVSNRAAELGIERGLRWEDRLQLAPIRIGVKTEDHTSWRRGSALSRLSASFSTSLALADAARAARSDFGELTDPTVEEAIQSVEEIAESLGVSAGSDLKAMLDPRAVSMNAGAIAIHSRNGVPIRSLGTGSLRLLTAGMAQRATAPLSAVLIDEVELGLEPHRILRLLDSLGAKDADTDLQVFATTHSPVVVRELDGDQIQIVRRPRRRHEVLQAGTSDAVQSTLRSYPEAMLAKRVMVCEGQTEMGLLRGLDQYRVEDKERVSYNAVGTALIVAGGGSPEKILECAKRFNDLGYEAAAFLDHDKPIDGEAREAFESVGGVTCVWPEGMATETALFAFLPQAALTTMLDIAERYVGAALVQDHIQSASGGALKPDDIRAELAGRRVAVSTREALAAAALTGAWYKTVGRAQAVGRQVLGPYFGTSDDDLKAVVGTLSKWAAGSATK